MKKTLTWFGVEKEGLGLGSTSLFIRGGEEELLSTSIWKADRLHLEWKQVYFGAGSTEPDIEKLNRALAESEYVLRGKMVIVELDYRRSNILRDLQVPLGMDLKVVLTCVVDYIPELKTAVKMRTRRELIISVLAQRVEFDDENGMYADDVPLFEEECGDHVVYLAQPLAA